MTQFQRRTLLILLALGLLAALVVCAQRLGIEEANRTVALSVDYTEVANVALLSGQPVSQVLQQFRQYGVTHVALTETSLADAVKALPYPTPYRLPDNLAWQVKNKLPESGITADSEGFALASAAVRMPELGIGYDYGAAATIREAGLQVIARPRPDYTLTASALGFSLDAVRATGAKMVIFNGTFVLGNSGLLGQTAAALRERGLTWGFIELVPQDGAPALAKAVHYDLLRVHSISEAEMAQKVTPATAIDRYSLAVRERKVRVCYVRLFFNQGTDPLTANLAYVGQLAQTLREQGYALGDPALYAAPTPHRALHILLYAAIGAVVLGLVQALFCLSIPRFWSLYLLMVLVAVVQGAVGVRLLANVAGLLAAVVFPALGIILLRWPEQPRGQPARRAALAFLAISGVTLLGGLLIASLFANQPHLLGIESFVGVKPAALLPLLLVLAVVLGRNMPAYRETRLEVGEERAEAFSLRAGLTEALGYAVRYWHAVVILLGLVLVALLLLRSGNEPPVGASGLERQFRALLDHLLWVRPRTKEIFFGHPLLFLSLALLFRGTRRGLWLGLTAGAIGQISLLNTFCHLHTPLLVSLVRAFHGLWIGLLIGLLLWAVVTWCERRTQRATESAPEETAEEDDGDDEDMEGEPTG
jgi:hypothetical protein